MIADPTNPVPFWRTCARGRGVVVGWCVPGSCRVRPLCCRGQHACAHARTIRGDYDPPPPDQNPGFIELREIQYAKDVAETLSTSSNKVYLNSDALLVSGIARALGRDEHQSKSKGGWLWN